MKNKLKQMLACFMAILMAVGAFAVPSFAADETYSGEFSQCTWSYDTVTATLTLNGSGEVTVCDDELYTAMEETGCDFSLVKTLVFGEGITDFHYVCFYTGGSVSIDGEESFREDIYGNRHTEEEFNEHYINDYNAKLLTFIEKICLPSTYEGELFIYPENKGNVPVFLNEFEVSQDNPKFTVVDGILFSKDMTELIAYPASKEGASYTVPDETTTIHDCAFGMNFNLETLNLNNTEYFGCTDDYCGVAICGLSLKEIDFGSKLKRCGQIMAVYMTEAIFPETLEALESGVFPYCLSLTSVTVPASVQTIDETAFFNCPSLEKVTIYGNPEVINTSDDIKLGMCELNKEILLAEIFFLVEELLEQWDYDTMMTMREEKVDSVYRKYYPHYSESDSSWMELDNYQPYYPDFTVYGYYNTKIREYCEEKDVNFVPFDCTDSHDYQSITEKEATCTEDGLLITRCMECGEISAQEVIPALGHSASDWIIDANADCTTAGSKHKECTVCHETLAYSGEFSQCTWSYDTVTATLTLNGSGAVTVYDDELYAAMEETGCDFSLVKTLVFGEGITDFHYTCFCTGPYEDVNGEWIYKDIYGNVHTEEEFNEHYINNYNAKFLKFIEKICLPSTYEGESFIWPENKGNGPVFLNEFEVSQDNPKFTVVDGILFSKDMTELIAYPASKEGTSYTVPDETTTIHDDAFRVNFNLETLNLNNTEYFGCNDHYRGNAIGSLSLKEIDFGSKLKRCGYIWATNITEAIFPETLEALESGVFRYCLSLTSVTVPASIQTIDDWVFVHCPSLEKVTVYGNPEVINTRDDLKLGLCAFNEEILQAEFSVEFDELLEQWDYDTMMTMYEERLYSVIRKYYPHYSESGWMELDNYQFYYPDFTVYGYYNTEIREYCEEKDINFVPFDCTDSHDYQSITEKEATCTEDGLLITRCMKCGEIFAQEVIPALGHSASDWIIDANADCTTAGSKHKECTVCHEMLETEAIPAFGHTYTSAVTAPTCTADGFTTHTCSSCGDTYVADEVPATGHSFADWTYDWDNLIRSHACSLCGMIETEALEKTENGGVEIVEPTNPDTEFIVEEINKNGDKYAVVEKSLSENLEGSYSVIKTFDITLKNKDGVHVQPDGTVKVKLPLDWDKDGDYKVYRVNDDGTLTDMDAYREGSHMVFDTDHFSVYVIVDESPAEPEETEENDSPLDFFGKIIRMLQDLLNQIIEFFRSIGDMT